MQCLFAVIFDPAAFYGHHEYDMALTTLFSGYSDFFYDAYFKKIPSAKGYQNRMKLYHLFHYLNHWYGNLINLTINKVSFLIFMCDHILIFL